MKRYQIWKINAPTRVRRHTHTHTAPHSTASPASTERMREFIWNRSVVVHTFINKRKTAKLYAFWLNFWWNVHLCSRRLTKYKLHNTMIWFEFEFLIFIFLLSRKFTKFKRKKTTQFINYIMPLETPTKLQQTKWTDLKPTDLTTYMFISGWSKIWDEMLLWWGWGGDFVIDFDSFGFVER